jgi:hypothetical protein
LKIGAPRVGFSHPRRGRSLVDANCLQAPFVEWERGPLDDLLREASDL